MNIKRIVSVLLAILITLSVLSGCSLVRSSSVPSGVGEDGRFIYVVSRPANSSVLVENAAKDIRNVIKQNFETNITLIKDSSVEDYDGNYEILIGDTDREESAQAKQILLDNRINNKNDFIIKVINDKIVIQALSDENVVSAAQWFTTTFCQNLDTWSMLTKDYEFIYEHQNASSEGTNTINGVNLGEFKIVLPLVTSYLVGVGAEEIVDFYSGLGYSVDMLDDVDEPCKNEIIIGDTSRKESQEITADGDNYVIKVIDGKVVIKGGSELATWRGVKAFIEEVKKCKTGSGIAWTDSYVINGKYDATEEGAFVLNWREEFEGSVINLNNWNSGPMIGDSETSSLGGFKCWQDIFGNSPYNDRGVPGLKKLIYQSNGNLNIATQRLNEVDFVGGQISTSANMAFRYGVFEVRSILPPVPCSLGYWFTSNNKAIFAENIGKNFTTLEIDLIENFGSSTTVNANVHQWWQTNDYNGNKIDGAKGHNSIDGKANYTGSSKNNKKKTLDVEHYGGKDLSQEYHIYSWHWTDSFMRFALDGKTFLDYQYSDNPSAPIHCLMSSFITECQMGDASYGATYTPSEHEDYYEHKLDYIRIYQSDSINCQLITAAPDGVSRKVFYPEHKTDGNY